MKDRKSGRRQFISRTASAAGGLFLAPGIAPSTQKKYAVPTSRPVVSDVMAEVNKYRKLDGHAHVYFSDDSPAAQIDFADRLGIEKLVISRPIAPHTKGTPEQFRKCNDLVLRCVKQHPNRFIGQMTLNVAYQKESLEEIERCLDAGMVGLKVYNHVKINDPLFYPIIERFIDLDMVILMHVGIGKSRITYDPREPEGVSIPSDFVEAAERYPEAMLQFAHLAGGEDWEDAVKALRHSPNVYVDVSGSNNDARIIDFAVENLGVDRVLFGCDNSFFQGVGHMIDANLTEKQRQQIFFDNYNNILRKSGNNVD